MIKKMRRNSFISLLLVLCLFLQSFAPLLAEECFNNGKANISSAKEQFNEVYEKIMELKPIELDGGSSAAVGVASVINDPIGAAANLFGADNDYVDYNAKIDEANTKIKEAQDLAKQMKSEFDSGKFDKASSVDANKLTNGAITAQYEANKQCQETLKETGQMLVNVSGILDTIITVMGFLGPIAEIVAELCAVPFPIAAGVAKGVAALCEWGAVALTPIKRYIKDTGEGLIDAANAGGWSDQALINMNEKQMKGAQESLVETVVTVGMKGTPFKEGVDSAISKIGASPAAKKLLGENAGTVIKSAWDPNTVKAAYLEEAFGGVVNKYLSGVDKSKIYSSAASFVSHADSTLFKAGTGQSLPPLGGKALLKKGLTEGGKALVNLNYETKEANNEAGLNP